MGLLVGACHAKAPTPADSGSANGAQGPSSSPSDAASTPDAAQPVDPLDSGVDRVVQLKGKHPDPVKAGVLTLLPTPDARSADGKGVVVELSDDGSTWWTTGRFVQDPGANIPRYYLDDLVQVDPVTGDKQDWGTSMLVGKAGKGDGAGYVGEIAVGDGSVVWIARDEGGELTYDDYDVYAARTDGSDIHKIGESTIDWKGRSFSVYGDGNYPLVAAGHAYWSDGTNLGPVDGKKSTIKQAMSIFSAPLDGSKPMREAIPGAWYPRTDPCDPTGRTFTYLVSPTSLGDASAPAEVHRRVLTKKGTTKSDTIVWSSTDKHVVLGGASACGDVLAVAIKAPDPTTKSGHGRRGRVEVFGPDGHTSLRWHGFSVDAGGLVSTPHGVEFFQWNGNNNGQAFYYDFTTHQVYRPHVNSTVRAVYRLHDDTLVMHHPTDEPGASLLNPASTALLYGFPD